MKPSIAGQIDEDTRDAPESTMSNSLIEGRTAAGPFTQLESVTDPNRLAPHLDDAAHVPGGHAEALIEPRSEREVSEAVRAAKRVLAIGAQSSLTGGAT